MRLCTWRRTLRRSYVGRQQQQRGQAIWQEWSGWYQLLANSLGSIEGPLSKDGIVRFFQRLIPRCCYGSWRSWEAKREELSPRWGCTIRRCPSVYEEQHLTWLMLVGNRSIATSCLGRMRVLPFALCTGRKTGGGDQPYLYFNKIAFILSGNEKFLKYDGFSRQVILATT